MDHPKADLEKSDEWEFYLVELEAKMLVPATVENGNAIGSNTTVHGKVLLVVGHSTDQLLHWHWVLVHQTVLLGWKSMMISEGL